MARVTVEDCLDKIPNRFALVVLAAERARQLSRGAMPGVDCDNKSAVTALREIAAGLVRFREDVRDTVTEFIVERREAELDGALADAFARELAGARLTVREDLAPEPEDDADRRVLAAMARPRRLEQIWPLARTPRFRLLAFLHFLRGVGALDAEGV